MKDYYNSYIRSDLLILTCVFKILRTESINYFELDTGYSWDVVLRFKVASIKLISGMYWMCQCIESMMRWVGISIICIVYSKVNNKFLKSYDPSKPSRHITKIDSNDLYGHSVMQFLLNEILDWFNQKIFNLSKC